MSCAVGAVVGNSYIMPDCQIVRSHPPVFAFSVSNCVTTVCTTVQSSKRSTWYGPIVQQSINGGPIAQWPTCSCPIVQSPCAPTVLSLLSCTHCSSSRPMAYWSIRPSTMVQSSDHPTTMVYRCFFARPFSLSRIFRFFFALSPFTTRRP